MSGTPLFALLPQGHNSGDIAAISWLGISFDTPVISSAFKTSCNRTLDNSPKCHLKILTNMGQKSRKATLIPDKWRVLAPKACWEVPTNQHLEAGFLGICCGIAETDVRKHQRCVFCAGHCFQASGRGILQISEPHEWRDVHVRQHLEVLTGMPLGFSQQE